MCHITKKLYVKGGSVFTWTSGWDEGEDLSTVSINLLPGTWPIICAGSCKMPWRQKLDALAKDLPPHGLTDNCCAKISLSFCSTSLMFISTVKFTAKISPGSACWKPHVWHNATQYHLSTLLRLPHLQPCVQQLARHFWCVWLVTWQSYRKSYVSQMFKWCCTYCTSMLWGGQGWYRGDRKEVDGDRGIPDRPGSRNQPGIPQRNYKECRTPLHSPHRSHGYWVFHQNT